MENNTKTATEIFLNGKLGEKGYTHTALPMYRPEISQWLIEFSNQQLKVNQESKYKIPFVSKTNYGHESFPDRFIHNVFKFLHQATLKENKDLHRQIHKLTIENKLMKELLSNQVKHGF